MTRVNDTAAALTVALATFPNSGTVKVHPFQTAELGVASFACVACISLPPRSLSSQNPDAYNNEMQFCAARARAFGVSLGGCQYCGMGIRHNYVIRDAKGVHFVVGCECVNKTEDEDLITAVEAMERARAAAAREAKNAAKQAARNEARAARMEAEREADEDGLTLEERRDVLYAEARETYRAAFAGQCDGLVAVLRTAQTGGDFLPSILSEIDGGQDLATFAPRALGILAEMYAKTVSGKTRRAKEWQAANDAFYATLEPAQEAEATAADAWKARVKAIDGAYWTARKGGAKNFTA